MRRWPRVPRLRTLPRAGGCGRVHGVEHHDDFAWLGDAASHAVSAQLAAEKQYTQLHLQPLASAEMELYGQMASSIPAEIQSAPEPWGSYEYYTRTLARRDLPRFCRCQRGGGGGEEVLLDLGALADRYGFVSLGAFAVSPNHRMLAYTLDTSGAEEWTLWVVELATGAVHARIANAHGVEWLGDERLVYTAANRRGRPSTALLHAIGGAVRAEVLYEEDDEEWVLEVGATKGSGLVTLTSASRLATEVRLLDPWQPAAPPRLVAPRAEGVTYLVEQLEADWLLLIASTARGAPLRLATTPLASLPTPHTQWQPFWQGGGGSESGGGGEGGGAAGGGGEGGDSGGGSGGVIALEDIDVFDGWLALYARRDGVPLLTILQHGGCELPMPPPTPPTPTPTPPTPTLPRASLLRWLTSWVGWPPTPAAPVVPATPPWPTAQSPPTPPPRMLAQHEVALPSEGGPCRLVPAANRELRTRTMRFGHSSPASPPSQLEYNLDTRRLSLLQQESFSPGEALRRRVASWGEPRAAEAGAAEAIAKAGGASAVLGAAPSAVALPWLHCELRHVTAEDGTLIPVTLLHLTLTQTLTLTLLGTLVPVTLLHRHGLRDSAVAAAHPTLLTVYGACE